MIPDSRLKELIKLFELTKESMPYEHIEDELTLLKELSSLRSQKKALIEDGERLANMLISTLKVAHLPAECDNPRKAWSQHIALLKELDK